MKGATKMENSRRMRYQLLEIDAEKVIGKERKGDKSCETGTKKGQKL